MGRFSRRTAVAVVLVGIVVVALGAGVVGAGLLVWLAAQRQEAALTEIEDEDYAVRLARPGPAWHLLDRAQAEALNPRAVLGATHEVTGTSGLVLVEPAPDLPVGRWAEYAMRGLTATDATVIQPARIVDFHGLPAQRVAVSAVLDGLDLRMDLFVVRHGDFLYTFYVWALADPADPALADQFYGALSFIPGEVRGRSRRLSIGDQIGASWRVRGERFESAAHGLVVDGTAPWHLLVNDDGTTLNAFAEVGLERNERVWALIVPYTLNGTDPEPLAASERAVVQTGAVTEGMPPPIECQVSGRDVAFGAHRVDDLVPFHHRYGTLTAEDRLFAIHAWGLEREEVDAAVREVCARVTVLDGDARRRLRIELESEPDRNVTAGDGWSIRGGVYRDFTRMLRWSSPSRAWRMFGGDAARRRDTDAVLSIEHPELGIYGTLRLDDAQRSTLEEEHRTTLAWLTGDPSGDWELGAQHLGATEAVRTRTSAVVSGTPYEYDIVTAAWHGRVLTFILSTRGTDRQELRDAMGEAIAALDLRDGATSPVSVEGDRFVDERFGFEVTSPWPNATVTDATPELQRANASIVLVAAPRKYLCAFAMVAPPGGDPDQNAAFVTELMSNRMGGRDVLAGSETTAGTLDGRPASVHTIRRISEEISLRTHIRGGTMYGILISQRRPATDSDEIARSFRFMD